MDARHARFASLVAPRLRAAVAFDPEARSVYFVSNAGGGYDVWRASVAGDVPPERLTSCGGIRSLAVSPTGTILVAADEHGDERTRLFIVTESKRLEPLESAGAGRCTIADSAWSPDGRLLAFAAYAGSEVEVRVLDTTAASLQVIARGALLQPRHWSPDGSRLLVDELVTPLTSRIRVVDLRSGETLHVGPDDARTSAGPWRPDGDGFYVTTDAGGREWLGVAELDLQTRSLHPVASPHADVEALAASPDGEVLVWVATSDGRSTVEAIAPRSSGRPVVGSLPPGTVLGRDAVGLTVSSDGSCAALVWAPRGRPAELYTVAIGRNPGDARCVSRNGRLPGRSRRRHVEPSLGRYRSVDGREISVWLYGRSSAHGAPAVIAVHGGPAAQARPIYSPLFHYLASRGIVVAAPNIRGSTGYGKSFERLVYRDWGGGDVDDVEALRDWLVGELGVDAARVALFGSSYGGFVVLAALVRSPDRWAAAVDAYGPSNLVSFAESQPPQWRAIVRELIGDPETDAELLWERSPIRRVDRIVAPLLVIQGAHDWRVPRAESDELVAALRRLGRDVEYDVLLDEGHGLSRLESHSAAAWRVADWLEARLCGPRAASTSPKRGDTFAFSTTRGG